ncbi:MAG: septal ring lytic transglycosylase RlpA family protein [Saprospiraceae bacterium]|nr:septal ring lytic transglycosylase RlpA family protein [Saprospiraceae bacterium]
MLAQSASLEVGKCGMYPDSQHGKKTTSGEIYDKNQLTASHKSHPYGTILRVTRLDNKKSVEVRVNDRAPLLSGYVVDVSRKAAEMLGITRDGAAKVKVEVVTPANMSTQQPATKVGLQVQQPTAPVASSTQQPATTVALPVQHSTATTAKSANFATEADSHLGVPGAQKQPATQARTTATAPVAHSTASPTPPQTTPANPQAIAKLNVSELYQIEIKPVPAKTFGIQLAVLTSTENLFREIRKAQTKWPQKIIVSHEKVGINTTFKLILGPFATRKEAEAQKKAAAQKGYPRAFLVEFE